MEGTLDRATIPRISQLEPEGLSAAGPEKTFKHVQGYLGPLEIGNNKGMEKAHWGGVRGLIEDAHMESCNKGLDILLHSQPPKPPPKKFKDPSHFWSS